MIFRMAKQDDLLKLRVMYEKIISNMNQNKIEIWDEIYPCEFFSDDIEKKRLFVLTEESDEIISAFALCESNAGESYIKWKSAAAKVFYMDRFGVNVDYRKKGIGSIMLNHAIALTKERNAQYLRLFAVDINRPAIDLYLKSGFKQAEGIYEERISDDQVLLEYGFEIEV